MQKIRKYYLCEADIGEGYPYYSLIIKAENEAEATSIMRRFVEQDYLYNVEALGGIEEVDVIVGEITSDFIRLKSFDRNSLLNK
jgi:hypothetical protein